MVRIPEFPREEARYTKLTLRIGGAPALSPLLCRVSAQPYNIWWVGRQRPVEQTEEAAFFSFETDGPADVEVTREEDFTEAVVRPLSAGVRTERDGRTLRLRLPGPGQYMVEWDGVHAPLHLFANPMKDFDLPEDASRVIRFGPGVHRPGRIEVRSGQTVYLDPAAVVYGCVMGICADDVRVVGYGILDGSLETRGDDTPLLPYSYEGPVPQDPEGIRGLLERTRSLEGCLRFYRGRNIAVEGPVIRDCATFCMIPANVENLTVDWVKTVGMWRYNSDGIDLFNCRNVRISDCFLRNFDDCMVIKGICGWDAMNNENILVSRCTVCCDWGRALEIGAETNAPQYRNIVFEDCDLIHGVHVMMDLQHHNRARISGVVFRNIRCEYTKYQTPGVLNRDYAVPYEAARPADPGHPYLLVCEVVDSGLFAKDGLHGEIRDVSFEDIAVLADEGVPVPRGYLHGMDAGHRVEGVTVRNVTFNGRRLAPGELGIETNAFADPPRTE